MKKEYYKNHREGILLKMKIKYLTNKPERIKRIWRTMIARCCNPSYNKYVSYGAKGIKVCDEWKDFRSFKDWSLNNGYNDNLTIDRIDNEKGYSPSNCRWVTMKQQNRNKTNNIWLSYNGTSMCMSDWAEYFHVSPQAIWYWLNEKGMDASKVIERFINKQKGE